MLVSGRVVGDFEQLNFTKLYPTLMAYRGCGLDFLVTKCVFLEESKWGIQNLCIVKRIMFCRPLGIPT